jgi:hypothetical protein
MREHRWCEWTGCYSAAARSIVVTTEESAWLCLPHTVRAFLSGFYVDYRSLDVLGWSAP